MAWIKGIVMAGIITVLACAGIFELLERRKRAAFKKQVHDLAGGGTACFMWATFPQIADALRVMEAWGFEYKTCAFVWIKKNRKSDTNFWGMGAYTRANAEICLLGVTPGFKAADRVKSHAVHQVIETPIQEHSAKPDETRKRIVELLGDVPRIELFARKRTPGWDAWGDELE